MKRILFNVTAAAVMLGFAFNSQAQCPNNNYQYGTSNAPSTVGVLTTFSTCMYGGEYRLVNNMQAGSQYSLETCGDYSFDSQLTIYDNVTGALIAYNDDFCGLQSKVTFTSNGNSIRAVIDRYYCSNQSSCMTLKMTRLSGGAPASNPCDDITALSCGSTGSFSLNGSGSWNNLGGPWGTPGEEALYSFTAAVTGNHTVSLTNSGYYVDIFYKSGSCGSTGWTYGDDIYSSGSISVPMTAGTTYYLLVDDENTSASNGTITVNCPTPAVDPCNSVTPIASCGTSSSFSLSSGDGAWNNLGGPWGTPGKEAVFSYTATATGPHPITVTNSGYYVDLFYKSSGCGSTGWTYVNDIYSNETNSVDLTAGVTYLFLIDDENTSPSSGTITIGCPCLQPVGGSNGSLLVDGNVSYSGNTSTSCNQCSFRSSKDEIIALEITCDGEYTISTCGGASWDTYLFLSTQPCSGILQSNDDNCGLQSSITRTLTVGTYYVTVEAYSSYSSGAYTLSVSKTCDLSLSFDADVQGCGYNISCNGGSDGSVTAVTNGCDVSYDWDNGGATSATNSGLSTGIHPVSVSDGFGCSADGVIYLTEPTPVEVYAGEDQTVYNGYDPMSCADIGAHAFGGCPEYSYQWSDGSDLTATTTVCPTTSTVYTMTVTDANGCQATDDVNICVIDVICYAGNSDNQKVQMCHNYGANNPHTICVSADAVPAHLAHGDALGSCDEVNDCGTVSSAMIINDGSHHDVQKHNLELFPNPTIDVINIMFDADLESVSYTIVDALGKTVGSGEVSKEKSSVDVSSFESGVYYFKGEDHMPVIFVKK